MTLSFVWLLIQIIFYSFEFLLFVVYRSKTISVLSIISIVSVRADRLEPGQEGRVQRERPLLHGLQDERRRERHPRLQERVDKGIFSTYKKEIKKRGEIDRL